MTKERARERGSATIEFVSVGVLLMVPLVYFIIAMSRVQAASFAADGSAREASRAFATAADEADGNRRARSAVRLALLDQGFSNEQDGRLSVDCEAAKCLMPGTRVVVQVEVRVILPGVPHSLGRALSTSVTVRARQVAVVDEFRAAGDSQ